MNEKPDNDETGDIASGLIDLTEVDLAALASLDNPVLQSSLDSIRDEVEHPEEAIAGFQSSV